MDEGGSVIIFCLFIVAWLRTSTQWANIYIIALENSYFQPGLFFISGLWAMSESEFQKYEIGSLSVGVHLKCCSNHCLIFWM